MTMFWAMRSIGLFDETRRGENLLDTGAHFYDVYRCKDESYVSIGSIEPQFYAELLRLTGLDGDPEFAAQMDRASWPALKARLEKVFLTRTRDEWCELMEGTENSMRLWELTSQKPLGQPMRVPARIRWVDFSPDTRQIAIASADGTVGTWEVPSTRPLVASLKLPGDVTRVKFSPDGKLLAIAKEAGPLVLWDTHTQHEIGSFGDHSEAVRLMAFSFDGLVYALQRDERQHRREVPMLRSSLFCHSRVRLRKRRGSD
jgi:hypothetical protein